MTKVWKISVVVVPPSRPQTTGWSDKKSSSQPDLKELRDLIHNTVFKPLNITQQEDVKSAMGPYCAQVQKYCLLLFFLTAKLRCVWSSWPEISWCCPDTIFLSYFAHFGHVMDINIMSITCPLVLVITRHDDKVGKKNRAKGRLGERKLQQYSCTDCINNNGQM
jgi:hypothetical protein